MVLAAVQLLRDRPWGYVLAGVLLVKAAAIGLWVVAMGWFSVRRGFPVPAGHFVLFVALTATGAALGWRLLAALDGGRPGKDKGRAAIRHAGRSAVAT